MQVGKIRVEILCSKGSIFFPQFFNGIFIKIFKIPLRHFYFSRAVSNFDGTFLTFKNIQNIAFLQFSTKRFCKFLKILQRRGSLLPPYPCPYPNDFDPVKCCPDPKFWMRHPAVLYKNCCKMKEAFDDPFCVSISLCI